MNEVVISKCRSVSKIVHKFGVNLKFRSMPISELQKSDKYITTKWDRHLYLSHESRIYTQSSIKLSWINFPIRDWGRNTNTNVTTH